VTIGLIVLFAYALYIGAKAAGTGTDPWKNVKEYLTIALPSITGLLGSAMGFYFGVRSEQQKQDVSAAQSGVSGGTKTS
jgi:hypothetical protein